MIKKKTIKVTSGHIDGMTEDTASQDVEKSTWFRISVPVEVYDTSLRRRIVGANRRLIDGYAEDIDTSS